MNQRRRYLQAAVCGLHTLPGFAGAQTAQRVYRVGVLRLGEAPESPSDVQVQGIPNALRNLGYVSGRSLWLDQRWSGGDRDHLAAIAREMVGARMDVIVAVGTVPAQAAKSATSTIPIIVYGNFDPVAIGLVSNLARPGANMTGVLIAPDGTLAGKRLELLKLVVPQARRIALLMPDEPSFRYQLQEMRDAAAVLAVELIVVDVRAADYGSAFTTIAAARASALVVGSHQFFVRDRKHIIELAAKHRLPAMYEWREQVIDGGLMTYSTSLAGRHEQVATYVDRILKGSAPGDLPVDRPTKFELVINLKTARALGLTLPQTLLLRADEVIQ